jgi:hypothetical protein
MAKSPEYSDLTFVKPKAFGVGRDEKAVRYIVIHYTAGAERNTSAEDGASYDARRTDGVSTHYFVDSNSIVQCVLTKDRANAARSKGNRLGIQYELCGTVQTRAQWLDTASKATLQLAARQVARDCKKYGIPVRRLSVAETRHAWTEFPNGPKGIVGHVDCTGAYPEDGGTHTDPGPAFPWDVFLDMVRAEMAPPPPKPSGVDMSLKDEKIAVTTSSMPLFPTAKAGDQRSAAEWLALSAIWAQRAASQGAALLAALEALGKKDQVDEAALANAMAPGIAFALLPLLADALPDGAELSKESLTAALVEAFRQMTAGK